MLQITHSAQLAMCDFFKDKDFGPVRIVLKNGGCGIRFFDLETSSPRAGDVSFRKAGFTYLIDQNLLADHAPIKIDSDGFSFRISGGGIHPPTGCGTCPFSCRTRGKMDCTGDCINCKNKCRTGKRKIARKQFEKNYMQ